MLKSVGAMRLSAKQTAAAARITAMAVQKYSALSRAGIYRFLPPPHFAAACLIQHTERKIRAGIYKNILNISAPNGSTIPFAP